MNLTPQERTDLILALSLAAEREVQIIGRLTEQNPKFHGTAIRERQALIQRLDALRTKIGREKG